MMRMTDEELGDAIAHLQQGRRSLLATALSEELDREARSGLYVEELARAEEDLLALEQEALEREQLEEGLAVLSAWSKAKQAELREYDRTLDPQLWGSSRGNLHAEGRDLVSKKRKREERDRERARADVMEIARATRPAKNLVPGYNPVSVYSLTAAGSVRAAMTFRRSGEEGEDDYTHGSGWNLKEVGCSLDAFKARYTSLGFEVREHDKPKRVNFEANIKVGRAKREASPEELADRVRVLELRLAGSTFKEIEAELGWDEDGKRAAKVFKEAMA